MPIIEGKAAAGTGKEGMNRLGRLPEPIFLYYIFDPRTCVIPKQCFDNVMRYTSKPITDCTTALSVSSLVR